MATARINPTAMPFTDTVSVIIPTLNEEQRLPKLLEFLALEQPRPEVIVVDGGSLDHTADKAEIWADKLLVTPPGRGYQLNQGAKAARGEILWFLHADSEPPRHSVGKILEVLHNRPDVLGGAFRLKFGGSKLSAKAVTLAANALSKFFAMPWGDQGLFVRKSVFEELGGFPDAEKSAHVFPQKLAKHGKTYLMKEPLVTSPRKYERLGTMKAAVEDLGSLWRVYK